jgi:hypothetical protein
MSDANASTVSGAHERAPIRGIWWLLFGVGLVASLIMVFRFQPEGDQMNMLYHGWKFAFDGEWLQYGLNTSAGGDSPGGMLSLFVGLPLAVWPDHRAPALLVWVLGLAAYLILDRIVGRVLGPFGRVIFAVFYWINPWRVHFTSSLWNANYMIFLGSLHLWAAWQLRRRPRFWPSLVCVVIVGLGVQLHTSAVVLAFATLLLWWRGVIKVDWWGIAAGVAVVVASLLPWVFLVLERPEMIPGGTGFPFRNLVVVYPVLRGLLYLLRYPSLAVTGEVLDLDFYPNAPGYDSVSDAIATVVRVIGGLTILLSCASYRRILRRPRQMWSRPIPSIGDRAWLRRYLFWTLSGAVCAFAFSPTTVMFWQGFPVMHAAVLVTVLFIVSVDRSQHVRRLRGLLTGYAVLSLVVVCVLGVASHLFRPPGAPPAGPRPPREDYWNRMTYDHQMFHDLKLMERCRVIVDPEYGTWPNSFPDP